jgi:23S rRNA (adenine2503-C2)-methyltransferase
MSATDLHLYNLNDSEMFDLMTGWGEPTYRAKQLWEWLYSHKPVSIQQMHTLSAGLRERLIDQTYLSALEPVHDLQSTDGETRKWLFRLPDGQLIETVLMEYSGVRRTVCISTQAGCAMGCVFCATGQMGFVRNLTAGEIIEQAVFVARNLEQQGQRLSNIVLMGMGEPFHNYDASLAAIRRFIDPHGLGIGQRHVTVSTVGLVPAIHRFAAEDLQVRLAISLHASDDVARSRLLPINQRYPISAILDAVQQYVDQVGRRVSFEWALIENQNDSPEQAHALGRILHGILCHLNVIPLNPTGGYSGKPPDFQRVNRFVEIVSTYGVPATVRVRRGIDIHAGCGQLKANVDRLALSAPDHP